MPYQRALAHRLGFEPGSPDHALGGGGGTQIIVGRGCAAETSEPIPTSKGPFAEIGTHV